MLLGHLTFKRLIDWKYKTLRAEQHKERENTDKNAETKRTWYVIEESRSKKKRNGTNEYKRGVKNNKFLRFYIFYDEKKVRYTRIISSKATWLSTLNRTHQSIEVLRFYPSGYYVWQLKWNRMRRTAERSLTNTAPSAYNACMRGVYVASILWCKGQGCQLIA